MSIAYFDCSSGIAGDMVLGALVDAGMPVAHLKARLAKLPLRGYSIRLDRGDGGANLRVEAKGEGEHRDYAGIDRMIARSGLSASTKTIARAIFARLAQAEAKIHGVPVGRVHFHEVGSVDSIVDIVGCAIGLDFFGFDEIFSSPLPMTRGRVKCRHGVLPAPAPAALEIMKGIPLEPSPARGEIVTPTGAAIIAAVASRFGECPLRRVEAVGYGFGDRRIPGIPNALRLMIGEGFQAVVIETNIDDMNPELFDCAIKQIFAVGAVDCHLEPIQMKKNRPGVKLVAIAPWHVKDAVIDAILSETTSFGVRYWPAERRVLTREIAQRKVKRGKVSFKLGLDAQGRVVKAIPEYEDVKKLAERSKRPLIEVYGETMAEGVDLVGRAVNPGSGTRDSGSGIRKGRARNG